MLVTAARRRRQVAMPAASCIVPVTAGWVVRRLSPTTSLKICALHAQLWDLAQ